MKRRKILIGDVSAVLDVSKRTVNSWIEKGSINARSDKDGGLFFYEEDLEHIPEFHRMFNTKWDEESRTIPERAYTSVELFAGAGGLAIGLERAGFEHMLLNEFDKDACRTLRHNRSGWNVVEGDIREVDFSGFRGRVDLLSGGFPCQAFSYAGKGGGFADTRGTLFFELARAAMEMQPKVILCENVKGLTSHDGGKTFATICKTFEEIGYTLFEPQVLRAVQYRVPQRRERIILVALKNEYVGKAEYRYPQPFGRVLHLSDALHAGELYPTDVPESAYPAYSEKKAKVLGLVPEGGDWRDLPEEVAKEYMGNSWGLGGGKTGMARRLSMDEPSLTLTCAPAQKQTERCHPKETRPLSVREYARIQTFPDEWEFCGDITAQYKQIGNAVPVNMAEAIGRSIVRLLNDIE